MIFSRTGGYMGLSFAIPIDVADDVREQLVKHRPRRCAAASASPCRTVNAQLAAIVRSRSPARRARERTSKTDSPAAKAGVKAGDVILSVNGARHRSRRRPARRSIAKMKPGSKAELQVWRDGKERTIDVRVDEMQEKQQDAHRGPQASKADEAGRLGIAVRPLTPEEKQQVETEGSLVVEEVSGAAALAGVQPGDIILGVNGKPVASVQQLRGAVKQKQSTVALLDRARQRPALHPDPRRCPGKNGRLSSATLVRSRAEMEHVVPESRLGLGACSNRCDACVRVCSDTWSQSGGGVAVDPGAEWRFVRLAYSSVGARSGSRGGWLTDWPDAEQHLIKGVQRLTRIDTADEGQSLSIMDESLFDYPWIVRGRSRQLDAERRGSSAAARLSAARRLPGRR